MAGDSYEYEEEGIARQLLAALEQHLGKLQAPVRLELEGAGSTGTWLGGARSAHAGFPLSIITERGLSTTTSSSRGRRYYPFSTEGLPRITPLFQRGSDSDLAPAR